MSCKSTLTSPGEDISGKLFIIIILDGSSSNTAGKPDLNSGRDSLREKRNLRSSVQWDSLLSSERIQLRACLKQALHSTKLAGLGIGASGQDCFPSPAIT